MSDDTNTDHMIDEAEVVDDGFDNPDLSEALVDVLQQLDLVNAQLGTAGALVVSQYQIQKQIADSQMQQQQQGGYQQPGMQQGQGQQQPPQYPPIVQDFASLANILTQIQYDLFDITVTLAQQQLPEQIETRIDEKAIQWITDISAKISGQLPQHTDPILPIGNQLATSFYTAKTLCQQAATGLSTLDENENGGVIGSEQADLHDQYLQHLQSFLFAAFRWSNLILGERDWYWKPKSEMQQNQAGGGQGQPGGGGQQPMGGPQQGMNPQGGQPMMNQQPAMGHQAGMPMQGQPQPGMSPMPPQQHQPGGFPGQPQQPMNGSTQPAMPGQPSGVPVK